MRVPYRWLLDFVDLPWRPDELPPVLTGLGLKVEAVERWDTGIDGVVVGRITGLRPHPQANRLQIAEVDAGTPDVLSVVTGATNIRVGDLVPVAPPGARLPEKTIETAEFRGVTSEGMLCSARELGLDEGGEGILILGSGLAPGDDARQALGMGETVYELELTVNYASYAQSILGVARELGAYLGQPVREPRLADLKTQGPGRDRVRIDIDSPELCPRYTALLLNNVRVGASPAWMQARLRQTGMRPINNLVDITNYVMLELGQPLHAFDYERLREGRIVVRRARKGEAITTLDGVTRSLDESTLCICDAANPVAIAGVMGGQESEVAEGTRIALLESANFERISVRRTARRLALHSEASGRFSKGTDPGNTVTAARRVAALCSETGTADVLPGVADAYVLPQAPRVFPLRPERVNALLGTRLAEEEIVSMLERLGFAVVASATPSGEAAGLARRLTVPPLEEGPNARWEEAFRAEWERALTSLPDRPALLAVVPTRRPDMENEVDLAEEVARLHGYNNLDSTLPGGTATKGGRSREAEFVRHIRQILRGFGLSEAVTYTLQSADALETFAPGVAPLVLANPMVQERAALRTSLLPGMIEAVAHNVSRRVRNVSLFEVGPVYLAEDAGAPKNLPREEVRLCLAVAGELEELHWQGPPRVADFYHLKGVLDGLARALSLPDFEWRPEDVAERVPYLHPGRGAILRLDGKEIGIAGELHPNLSRTYDVADRVYVAELEFTALLEGRRRPERAAGVARFPSVQRDLAVILPERLPVEHVMTTIRRAAGDLLVDLTLFDRYRGPGVREGSHSLAFRLTYQSNTHTLTDAEVETVHDAVRRVVSHLEGAVLRS